MTVPTSGTKCHSPIWDKTIDNYLIWNQKRLYFLDRVSIQGERETGRKRVGKGEKCGHIFCFFFVVVC